MLEKAWRVGQRLITSGTVCTCFQSGMDINSETLESGLHAMQYFMVSLMMRHTEYPYWSSEVRERFNKQRPWV